VVDGKVVASMRREAQTGDFRSNLHRGGTARSVRITKEERDAAIRAAKILGLEVAGVDLLRSNSGPKVLEVNSSPGLQGIESVSNKDIADLIIQHIERRAHPIVRRRTGRRAAAD
jgi:ribosomal protein S6--L-glutamate ligase